MSLRKRSSRALLASIMLVPFALRALIPPGFMPASDRPFSIEICWEGFPANMLAQGEPPSADSMGMDSMQGAHHHHSGSPPHSEHCVFGTCSAGPTPHLPLPSDTPPTRRLRATAVVSIAGAVRLVHLPQSRAPPGRPS